jgi:hypothetical protein
MFSPRRSDGQFRGRGRPHGAIARLLRACDLQRFATRPHFGIVLVAPYKSTARPARSWDGGKTAAVLLNLRPRCGSHRSVEESNQAAPRDLVPCLPKPKTRPTGPVMLPLAMRSQWVPGSHGKVL